MPRNLKSFVYKYNTIVHKKHSRLTYLPSLIVGIVGYFLLCVGSCHAVPTLESLEKADPFKTIVRHLSSSDKNYTDSELFTVAQAFHEFGLNNQALNIYEDLIKSTKLSQSQVKECAINAAVLRLQQGEYEATIEILSDPSLKFKASEVIPLHFKAFAYYFKNEVNRARTLFESIIGQRGAPSTLANEAHFYLGIIKRDEGHLSQIKMDSDYYNRALIERLRLGNLAVLDQIEVAQDGEARYYQLLRNAKQKRINTSSYKRNKSRLDQISNTAWRNLTYATLNQEVFEGLIKTLNNNESNYK